MTDLQILQQLAAAPDGLVLLDFLEFLSAGSYRAQTAVQLNTLQKLGFVRKAYCITDAGRKHIRGES